MTIAYTVIANFADRSTRDQFIRWLEEGHVDAVIAKGAHSASIVRLDADAGTPLCVEVRYLFASREVLDTYLREHAPSLRAQGLELFPPEKGVQFRRTIGEVL